MCLGSWHAVSCMTNVEYILLNRRFLSWKNLFQNLLILLPSDYFCATHNFLSRFTCATDSVSITMCSERADEQDTFLVRHRCCHADFYDALQAFNPVDTTLPDPSLRMREGRREHYSYFLCGGCFMTFLRLPWAAWIHLLLQQTRSVMPLLLKTIRGTPEGGKLF